MSVYLHGVYASGSEREWFEEAYRATGKRLDMGKSCVRFRKLEDLPLALIGKAVARMESGEFIQLYEESRRR